MLLRKDEFVTKSSLRSKIKRLHQLNWPGVYYPQIPAVYKGAYNLPDLARWWHSDFYTLEKKSTKSPGNKMPFQCSHCAHFSQWLSSQVYEHSILIGSHPGCHLTINGLFINHRKQKHDSVQQNHCNHIQVTSESVLR